MGQKTANIDIRVEPQLVERIDAWRARQRLPPSRTAAIVYMLDPFVAVSEARAARADGDHCREMAGKLRELAHYTRSPGMRRELVDLARRYDRRGDHFDGRPR